MPGRLNVLRELRLAVGLVHAVLARCLLADQPEILGLLEHHAGWHRFPGGVRGQFAETQLAASTGAWLTMPSRTVISRRRHLPALRAAALTSMARPCRPGGAQLVPGIGHCRAAAGAL
jgi:hypothetical protein